MRLKVGLQASVRPAPGLHPVGCLAERGQSGVGPQATQRHDGALAR